MSDRDDELTRLFSHRVSPLAPPPGTFERITRTARRRRRTRAVLAATSSAVVLAGGAGAYALASSGSLTGLGQHHVAGGSSPTPGGGRTASPAPSTSPSAAAPTPSAQPSGPPGAAQYRALPAGWVPQSVSFTSASQGFAVGAGPNCSVDACQGLAYTDDGGVTWRGLTFAGPRLVPVGSGATAATDVSQIRFSAGSGYAFGPGLWVASGWSFNAWQRQNVGTVLDLAATSRSVFAVVTHCNPADVAGAACSRSRPGPVLITSPVGLDAWTAVRGVDLGSGPGPVTADLQIQGQGAYLLLTRYAAGTPAGVQGAAATGTVLYGAADGVHWQRLPAACSGPGPTTLALSTPSTVLVGCPDGSVLLHSGGPATAWRPLLWRLSAAPTALSVAPGGQALLATVGGRVIGSTDGGRVWSTPAGLGGLAAGTVSFVGFTTADQAVVVSTGSKAAVWLSRDAGRTWQPVVGAQG